MGKENAMEVFDKMPVSKAIFKNAIPAIIAMLMVLIYNLADTFFIGQTHDALQVAAVSLATPVFLLFMAVGTAFGIGGTSVISRALGAGKKKYAKKVCSFCMWGCVITGIVMSVLMWIFINQILSLIGASSETWGLAKNYLMIVICSGPFVLISNCYSNILRAEGQSTKAMLGSLIGNIVNVILDPIMILGFKRNIIGAAVATVIGNVLAALYYILYFIRGKSTLSISIKDFTIKHKVLIGTLAIGIPASLGTILMSISQIVVNSQMASYGDMAIAGMGVAMKVVTITGMICMGLGQGVQALFGYSIGAKNWDRYKKLLKFSLCFALILGIVLTGLSYLATNQIVKGFVTDENAFNYGVEFSRILLTTSALFGVYYILINALQAMGASISSLIINISRQGLIFIPAVFILKGMLGLNGVVWAQPVADIISLLLAFGLYIFAYKRLKRNSKGKINEKF